jgi:hypothetical protein
MIRAAVFAPMPGSVVISVADAVLMFTIAADAGLALARVDAFLAVGADCATAVAGAPAASTNPSTPIATAKRSMSFLLLKLVETPAESQFGAPWVGLCARFRTSARAAAHFGKRRSNIAVAAMPA